MKKNILQTVLYVENGIVRPPPQIETSMVSSIIFYVWRDKIELLLLSKLLIYLCRVDSKRFLLFNL